MRAIERHKMLFPAAVAGSRRRAKTATALEDDYIHLVWEADHCLETARQALDQFRASHGIA